MPGILGQVDAGLAVARRVLGQRLELVCGLDRVGGGDARARAHGPLQRDVHRDLNVHEGSAGHLKKDEDRVPQLPAPAIAARRQDRRGDDLGRAIRLHNKPQRIAITLRDRALRHWTSGVTTLRTAAAGKSTLTSLLVRLVDPDEGAILLDGHDLREYDLDEVRANMGVIFQDFVRFHMTARENIAVGSIGALDDDARIEEAARRGLAHDTIMRLPGGYDQVIGKRFRTGVDLSGGEWQKIAIARAYMRDAQLLILDEPTAALDARAEFEVFQRFKELSHRRSAVLISHRFSSVRMADRILVLADGEIEAMGTHEELLAQRGRYAELFELQASGYR